MLTEDCPVIDTTCTTCVSGEKGCGATYCPDPTTPSDELEYCPEFIPTTTEDVGTTITTSTTTTSTTSTTTTSVSTITVGPNCPNGVYYEENTVSLEDACYISSPGFPDAYDPCQQSEITVKTYGEDVIQLEFDLFELDSDCCECDTVTLWDGDDTLLAELNGCDDPLGLIFRASSGEMKVVFISDGANVEEDQHGYLATITRD